VQAVHFTGWLSARPAPFSSALRLGSGAALAAAPALATDPPARGRGIDSVRLPSRWWKWGECAMHHNG
jgi:hypothetical protein